MLIIFYVFHPFPFQSAGGPKENKKGKKGKKQKQQEQQLKHEQKVQQQQKQRQQSAKQKGSGFKGQKPIVKSVTDEATLVHHMEELQVKEEGKYTWLCGGECVVCNCLSHTDMET